jgi:signal peptidase I
MNNLPSPGTLYRKFNVQELINMTLKKAYHTLVIILILATVTVALFALGVSKIALSWGIIGFSIAFGLATITLIYGVYSLKKEKVNDNAHILVRYRYEVLDWLSFLGVSMMVIFIVFMFFLLPSDVSQNSMLPTLNDGDRILLYHFNYQPNRGDVVVVGVTKAEYPNVPIMSFYDQNTGEFKDSIFFVKRIIAVPGDQLRFVNYDNQTGRYQISVNDNIILTPYDEPYHATESQREQMEKDLDLSTNEVLEGVYFTFGDNAEISFDSRSFGAVKEKDVLGKVIYRFWPMGGIS